MKITRVLAREVFDSRGIPALQCELQLEDNFIVSASVGYGGPSDKNSFLELRDGGSRLGGMGLTRAVKNIEFKIAPLLLGQESNPLEMDLAMLELDGTHNKSHLGANTLLAVSMALYKAQAVTEELELYELLALISGKDAVTMPIPLINLISGHSFSRSPKNELAIKECLIAPLDAPNFRASFEMSVALQYEIGAILDRQNKETAIGPDGGRTPFSTSEREILGIVHQALAKISSAYDYTCAMVLDIGASRWYDCANNIYAVRGVRKTSGELISWYKELIADYPIYGISDGLGKNDLEGWHQLSGSLQENVHIIGDELFLSNPYRIAQGVDLHIADSVIIRPHQIGTITETLQLITHCKEQEIEVIIGSEYGGTEETFLADLSVGTSVNQIRAGGIFQSQHLAKYNRLLAIEDALTVNLLI